MAHISDLAAKRENNTQENCSNNKEKKDNDKAGTSNWRLYDERGAKSLNS